MKDSTHIGLEGVSLTMAASPFLMFLGASSTACPVRRSTLFKSSVNLQAMWAVWQSNTGAYPAWIVPGWLRMMTWALKDSVS